jgi:hypothetical protein
VGADAVQGAVNEKQEDLKVPLLAGRYFVLDYECLWFLIDDFRTTFVVQN